MHPLLLNVQVLHLYFLLALVFIGGNIVSLIFIRNKEHFKNQVFELIFSVILFAAVGWFLHKYHYFDRMVSVHTFGAMIVVAFISAMFLVNLRSKSYQFNKSEINLFCLLLLFVSIIGARGLYVFQNWSFYKANLIEIFMLQNGGLVFYGGLIVGLIFSLLYLKFKKWSIWKVADLLAPSLALGHAFGRIGCFFNGCCFGDLTTVPWGVQFPDKSPAAVEFGPLHVVHPTQLYSAGSLLVLCLVLLWLDRRKKFSGQTFISYLFGYSIIRFIIEIYRGDNPEFLFHLTISQFISCLLFVTALILFKFRLPHKNVQSN